MQALWMLLGAFLFASMGVCIKFASAYFNSFEIVFYRGLVGVVFLAIANPVRGVSLRTRVPMMHVWRSAVGVTALTSWFFAIAALPLGAAVTLNYMSSVWVAAFLLGGALINQQQHAPIRQQAPLFLTVLAGFGGVAMMLRPTVAGDQMFGALLGLLSGLFAAFAYMQVSALARAGEPESRTVFYFSIGATLTGAIGSAFAGFTPLTLTNSVWLLPIGLLAMFGQLCMTRAYSSGATLVVANLQYAGIVFAGIYSLLLFDDHLPPIGWAGMALIIASGITATALRARAVPIQREEDHAEDHPGT
ncbi:DMT family transporter [Hydrogenophaga sp. 5NK40-0174]|uniref:DMT family transporter n=1 Tax=Hydrogenophaga sp. 5NK40-0174 TaxID=3127649 RepID=UPI00310A9CB9